MALTPKSGLGRFLLGLIAFTTLAYLVLNLVSFGGIGWITYIDVPIQFGLWRVCDTSAGACNQWADNQYTSSIVNATFSGGKPGFIRSSQALEIISLIFYIIAAVLIILGILDLDGLPFDILFIAAAILLFICIVFLSATLGLMSVQGRNNHAYAYLSWAWWNGLVGLIMTIIDFFALIAFIFDMKYSATNAGSGQIQRPPKQNDYSQGTPPILAANALGGQPYNYSNYNQHPQQYQPNWNYSPHQQYNQYPQQQQQQQQQYFPNNYYPDSMMFYGDQSPAEQYFNNQSPSPIISSLAREYVLQASDAQYQNQLLAPYRQYLQDPYLINNYL